MCLDCDYAAGRSGSAGDQVHGGSGVSCTAAARNDTALTGQRQHWWAAERREWYHQQTEQPAQPPETADRGS